MYQLQKKALIKKTIIKKIWGSVSIQSNILLNTSLANWRSSIDSVGIRIHNKDLNATRPKTQHQHRKSSVDIENSNNMNSIKAHHKRSVSSIWEHQWNDRYWEKWRQSIAISTINIKTPENYEKPIKAKYTKLITVERALFEEQLK